MAVSYRKLWKLLIEWNPQAPTAAFAAGTPKIL